MTIKYDYIRKASADYRFFLFDPEGDGVIFFKSTDDRDAYAKTSIRDYLSACEGWDEDVETVCAGEVTHVVKKIDIVKRPPPDEIDEDGIDGDGNWWDADWGWMCNYALTEIGEAGK